VSVKDNDRKEVIVMAIAKSLIKHTAIILASFTTIILLASYI
jgi:hypothetical protein